MRQLKIYVCLLFIAAAAGFRLHRAVEVSGQIKTLGTHPVTVRLHPEVTTELNVAVVAG